MYMTAAAAEVAFVALGASDPAVFEVYSASLRQRLKVLVGHLRAMQNRSNQTQRRARGILAGHRTLLLGLHLVAFAAWSRNAEYLGQKPAVKET
jgi:hypothetical protein